MHAEEPHDVEAGTLIGGCYRVEAEIGQGGTARVYRVLDERTGQRFALKRLVSRGQRSSSVQAMFEREYHTLVQLAHPRIIRAFDYGFDGIVPYYTMELLDGIDARALARQDVPPSVQQVCSLLRDVASALALIHSRRLLHRDVSPRNVWCTPDGRAKLIDFGTLVAMGPQTRVAGTPPFVPPEAFYLQPLDARCDLYALGALAYFLLTRRYGYAARDLRELPEMWERRPQRPSALRAELPPALDELVMGLMSLDARGRPASAAEVLERLTAIAGLPAEDERPAAQAFLSSPTLVGRDDVVARVRKHLRRAEQGRGVALSLVARHGMGRSRVLSGIALEARLLGMTAVALDAAAAGSMPLALVATLSDRLLDALPGLAAECTDLAPALALSRPEPEGPPPSEPSPSPSAPKAAALPAGERARRVRAAVVELVMRACRHARVLITVDDVHRADAASLDVLARLSLVASSERFVLLTTCDAAALAHAPPALAQLTESKKRIELTALSADATRELLESLFGQVPGLDQAASFLHELSAGSPQTCMQYAQYLVDHDIARYEGGRWELPSRLREHALPATLDAMLEGRLSALSEDARTLALGLALARDESRATWQPETHVRLEDFAMLLGADAGARNARDSVRVTSEAARTFAALDELLRAGMVQQRDDAYVLAGRVLADALVRRADDALCTEMHERLATVFDSDAYSSRWLAIRQLQRAGNHARARERLIATGAGLGGARAMDWGGMRVSVSAECLQLALADFEQHGGAPLEGILLRRVLLLTAAVYDWSLARFGKAQLDRLRADTGLSDFDQTDPAQPQLARVIECLKRAQQVYDATPEAQRGMPPGDAVRELASCAIPLQAALVNSQDVAGARAIPAILEPLRALSPAIEVIADVCQLGVDRAVGRELGDRIYEIGAVRLSEATALPEVLRQGGGAINLYTQALHDARRGRARALELMTRLAETTGDDMFMVLHARWLCHAFRGEAEQARPLRKQLEVISEDDVWRRKASLFVEAELHALTGDLTELRGVTEELTELSATFPGFRPWVSWARAAEHRLRSELGSARRELETALELAAPGEHRAYCRVAPAHAEILLLTGDAEGALRAAERTLQQVETLDLARTTAVAAERVVALAQGAAKRHAEARAAIERALALATQLGYDGLPLAVLHETEARLALAAGDAPLWGLALSRMRSLLEHAHAPTLIRSYEALREDGSRVADADVPPSVVGAASDLSGTTEADTQISARRTSTSNR